MGGGHFPPLGYAENSILHVNQNCKSFNDTINGELCLCENSPRFHLIASNKRSKIKISPGEHAPGPPHALHTNTYLPPNKPYNLILPPLGQKAERNPAYIFSCPCFQDCKGKMNDGLRMTYLM